MSASHPRSTSWVWRRRTTSRWLRCLWLAHQLTASEVAHRVPVLQHTVYNWEAGRARVPHRFLEPLAEVFSMSTDDLETWLRRGPVPVAPGPVDRSPQRRLRLAAGQSQDQLSRSAGVGLSSLKAWEYGAAPGLSAIRGLAQALDLPAPKLALVPGLELPRELVPSAWRPGDLPDVLRVLRLWSPADAGRAGRAVRVQPGVGPVVGAWPVAALRAFA